LLDGEVDEARQHHEDEWAFVGSRDGGRWLWRRRGFTHDSRLSHGSVVESTIAASALKKLERPKALRRRETRFGEPFDFISQDF
jgi:hypothetical protein